MTYPGQASVECAVQYSTAKMRKEYHEALALIYNPIIKKTMEALKLKPITVWKVQEKDPKTGLLVFVHNHIEDGFVDGAYPLPKDPTFTAQRAWANRVWKKEYALLDEDNKVITTQGEVSNGH